MASIETKIQALGFSGKDDFIPETQLVAHLGRVLQTQNLVVLSGAGTSILRNDNGKDLGGLTMAQLTDGLKSDTSFNAAVKAASSLNKKIIESINESGNIELLLSDLDSLIAADRVSGSANQTALLGIKKSVLRFMREKCIINNANYEFPHAIFLKKLLSARKLINPRIKVFTLNYDTLFEQAAQDLDAILIDGFSFSQPRKFQGNNFDLDIVRRNHSRLHKEESYYPNVFHLYKLHGSVDWRLADGRIEQVDPTLISDVSESVMVYPGSHKYQASYSMPFYEMISRLQATVREPNITLLIIGYSFGDEHINRVILEAASSNLGLSVYIISPSAADAANTKNSQTLKAIQKQVSSEDIKNIFCISASFTDFAKLLPHYGNDSSHDSQQTEARAIDTDSMKNDRLGDEDNIPF